MKRPFKYNVSSSIKVYLIPIKQ